MPASTKQLLRSNNCFVVFIYYVVPAPEVHGVSLLAHTNAVCCVQSAERAHNAGCKRNHACSFNSAVEVKSTSTGIQATSLPREKIDARLSHEGGWPQQTVHTRINLPLLLALFFHSKTSAHITARTFFSCLPKKAQRVSSVQIAFVVNSSSSMIAPSNGTLC